MKKLILTSIGFCLALGVMTTAAGEPVLTFEDIDINADGYISKEEAMVYKDMNTNWTKVDANKDGHADIDEFSRFEAIGRFSPPDDSEVSEPGAAPF